MSDDRLIKELREPMDTDIRKFDEHYDEQRSEAADCIEALRVQEDYIEELETKLREVTTANHDIGEEFDCLLDASQYQRNRIKWLEAHIQVLIDNDPNDQISDSGHSVLDLWRHEAKNLLKKAEDDG